MASNYKVLGQAAPALGVDTVIYTVPAAASAVISTISICNRSSTSVSMVDIAVVPAGQTLSTQHYIAFRQFIQSRSSINKTLGITLGTGDSIVVNSDSGNESFSVFGNEITV